MLPGGFEDQWAAGMDHHGQQSLPVQQLLGVRQLRLVYLAGSRLVRPAAGKFAHQKLFCTSRDAGRGDFKEVPTGPARLGVLCLAGCRWEAEAGTVMFAQLPS